MGLVGWRLTNSPPPVVTPTVELTLISSLAPRFGHFVKLDYFQK